MLHELVSRSKKTGDLIGTRKTPETFGKTAVLYIVLIHSFILLLYFRNGANKASLNERMVEKTQNKSQK